MHDYHTPFQWEKTWITLIVLDVLDSYSLWSAQSQNECCSLVVTCSLHQWIKNQIRSKSDMCLKKEIGRWPFLKLTVSTQCFA